MSIRKSLGLGLVIGLLAMAFAALPAVASAAPALTGPEGTLVPVGTTISATSTNAETKLGALGNLTCEHVEIHGKVVKNSGTEVFVEMDEKNDTATGCKLKGATVTVKPTFEELKLTSASKTAKFTFTVEPTGLAESSTSTVTYTGPNAKSIHVEGPVGGTNAGTFAGDFNAYYFTSKGVKVNITFD